MVLSLPNVVFGQTKVKVVTITKSEKFEYKEGVSLLINGERAEINISTHNENFILCTSQLISKHPDGAIAEKESKYHKWVSEKIGRKIVFRNFIEIPAGQQKPQSNLKTIYTIKLPADCPIEINNYFGKVVVEGTTNKLEINNEFSKINLNDIKGDIDVSTKFGDIEASNINGTLLCTSNRGDLKFSNIKGNIEIDVSSAAVSLLQQAEVEQFILKGNKANVLIDITNLNSFNFNLELEQIERIHPTWMDFGSPEKRGNSQLYKIERSKEAGTFSIFLQYGKLEFAEHSSSH